MNLSHDLSIIRLNIVKSKRKLYVAVLVDKSHSGFCPVNPLHKKPCLPKHELIIDPRP